MKQGRPRLYGRAAPLPTALRQLRFLSDRLGLVRAGSSRNLSREVFLLLLDAFTELEANESGKRDWRTGILGSRSDDFGNRGLAVHHEQLRGERAFLAELGEDA